MFSDDMEISEKLARLVRNQSEVSRRTGIAQSALSEASSGKRRLYVDQAFLIARAVGVPLDYLADPAQTDPPAPPRKLPPDEELALGFYRSMVRKEGEPTAVLEVLALMAKEGIKPPKEDSSKAVPAKRVDEPPPSPRRKKA